MVLAQTTIVKGRVHVRFGSKADICNAKAHVRFTPESDRESGPPQTVMSALPPNASLTLVRLPNSASASSISSTALLRCSFRATRFLALRFLRLFFQGTGGDGPTFSLL